MASNKEEVIDVTKDEGTSYVSQSKRKNCMNSVGKVVSILWAMGGGPVTKGN
jgi:hypothetical protein